MKCLSLPRLFLALLLIAVLSACGTDFRRAWRKAPENKGVAGKWEGTWNSEATGHQGKLRCVVTGPLDKSGNHEFFYHATWMGFLSGGYKATHLVRPHGDTQVFKGEHKMPDWAGGLYHYDGKIQGDSFKADYKSSMDNGYYTMKRVR